MQRAQEVAGRGVNSGLPGWVFHAFHPLCCSGSCFPCGIVVDKCPEGDMDEQWPTARSLSFLIFFLYPHLRAFFFFISLREGGRERGSEREKNIDMKEKHRSVASCAPPHWESYMPRTGPNPQPRSVPCPGREPATFQLRDDAPTNRATPAREKGP